MLRGNQSGAPNIGSTVLATCTSNHEPTRYRPAKRITLRRFSSVKKLSIFTLVSLRRVSGNADRCAVDPTQGRRAAKLWIEHDPRELPIPVQCDSGLIAFRRLVPRPSR